MDKKWEEILGYRFREPVLLQRALTHSSYANEHPEEGGADNERLEFLGDAVLELASSTYLYNRYPDKEEGEMTRLRASMVCEPSLAFCARRIDLGEALRMGRGEEKSGGRERDSILSDALEAVIGAVYLDGGFESARHFIDRHVLAVVADHPAYSDAKTRFQELVQADGGAEIVYTLLSEEGPMHERIFTAQVSVNGTVKGTGSGHSKKAAEQAAAAAALKEI